MMHESVWSSRAGWLREDGREAAAASFMRAGSECMPARRASASGKGLGCVALDLNSFLPNE